MPLCSSCGPASAWPTPFRAPTRNSSLSLVGSCARGRKPKFCASVTRGRAVRGRSSAKAHSSCVMARHRAADGAPFAAAAIRSTICARCSSAPSRPPAGCSCTMLAAGPHTELPPDNAAAPSAICRRLRAAADRVQPMPHVLEASRSRSRSRDRHLDRHPRSRSPSPSRLRSHDRRRSRRSRSLSPRRHSPPARASDWSGSNGDVQPSNVGRDDSEGRMGRLMASRCLPDAVGSCSQPARRVCSDATATAEGPEGPAQPRTMLA